MRRTTRALSAAIALALAGAAGAATTGTGGSTVTSSTSPTTTSSSTAGAVTRNAIRPSLPTGPGASSTTPGPSTDTTSTATGAGSTGGTSSDTTSTTNTTLPSSNQTSGTPGTGETTATANGRNVGSRQVPFDSGTGVLTTDTGPALVPAEDYVIGPNGERIPVNRAATAQPAPEAAAPASNAALDAKLRRSGEETRAKVARKGQVLNSITPRTNVDRTDQMPDDPPSPAITPPRR